MNCLRFQGAAIVPAALFFGTGASLRMAKAIRAFCAFIGRDQGFFSAKGARQAPYSQRIDGKYDFDLSDPGLNQKS